MSYAVSNDRQATTDKHGSAVAKHVITWTCAADGSYSETTPVINGVILRVVTNPGSTAPSDNYDITLTDEDGLDVLAGQGVDRDTANSEHFCPGVAIKDGVTTSTVPVAVAGALIFAVANAGNAKSGTCTIYVR